MEIKTLAKNTVILASPKILNFVVGLVKSKLIAIFLGTVGFGIVEQLTSSINQIRMSTLSFLPDGMVKLIAKERSENFDKGTIAEIIKTYFLMIFPLIIAVLLLSIYFSDAITLFVFGDLQYKDYFLIGLTALPITFISVSFRSLLKAFKEIKSFAKVEVYITIINFIIFFPLVYYFNILGAVIFATLTFFVSLLVTFRFALKNVFRKYKISLRSVKNAVFSKVHYRELLAFIGVGVIAGSIRVFENMASRSIVVNTLGIEKIGIYAPINKWQVLFVGFILPSIFTYLYPRLSEAKSDKEITGVINDVIRMITFITLPFVLLGIATREWIIPLFYSKDFLEASIYLPYHFTFILFMVWGTILEQIFAPTGRLKAFLFYSIFIYSTSIILVFFLVPKFGLYGYLIRFTVTPFLTSTLFFIFWRKEIKFKLKKENFFIVLYAISCSILMLISKDFNYILLLIMSIFLILSMYLFLRKNEKNFITKKIKTFTNKKDNK